MIILSAVLAAVSASGVTYSGGPHGPLREPHGPLRGQPGGHVAGAYGPVAGRVVGHVGGPSASPIGGSSSSSAGSYSYDSSQDYYDEPDYSNSHAVKDPYSGVNTESQENRLGDRTEGSYSVDLPDGRKMVVTYYVDGKSGYVADVQYYGEAVHPQTPVVQGVGAGYGGVGGVGALVAGGAGGARHRGAGATAFGAGYSIGNVGGGSSRYGPN